MLTGSEPPSEGVWFVPLGGTGEIGMNLNLYGHAGRWLMVDCGITFEHIPGSSSGRPRIEMADPQFIKDRRQRLDALLITHAHEDHLGGVPYLWSQLQCPVYATPFAAEVLRRKVAGGRGTLPQPLIEVTPGSTISVGDFEIDWLPLTHSTAETCALLLRAGSSRILHTADWKIDRRPVVGEPWAPKDWVRQVSGGIDAVICDSTNATREGFSPTEGDVADGLLQTIAPLTGKVVVSCFASNIARLQTLFRIAESTGRRVALMGRSVDNMYRCARRCDLLDSQHTPIDPAHVEYLPPQEILVVATGSQGEVGATLQKLVMDSHRHLSLGEGDTVILSAKTIPGNEQSVARVVEGLRSRGVQVLQDETSKRTLHASGHPCAGELSALYDVVKPKLAIPVHGEALHMDAHARVARQSGAKSVLTGTNGDLFVLTPEPGVRRRWAPTGRLFWDEERELLTADASSSAP